MINDIDDPTPELTPEQLTRKGVQQEFDGVLDAINQSAGRASGLTWGHEVSVESDDPDQPPTTQRLTTHNLTPPEAFAALGDRAIRVSTMSNINLIIDGILAASATMSDYEVYQLSVKLLMQVPGIDFAKVIPAGWSYTTNADGTVTVSKAE